MKEITDLRDAIKRENTAFRTNLMNELSTITHKKKKKIKALLHRKRKRLNDTKKEISTLLNDFDSKAIIADLNKKIEKFGAMITKQQSALEKRIARIRKIKEASFSEIHAYLEELKGVQNKNMRSVDRQAAHIQKNIEKFTRDKDSAGDKLFYNMAKR